MNLNRIYLPTNYWISFATGCGHSVLGFSCGVDALCIAKGGEELFIDFPHCL